MKPQLLKHILFGSLLFISSLCMPALVKAQAFNDAVVDSAIGLPVNFIAFAGQIEGEMVKLQWITANEENNSYFNIQRSVDGINFYTIGKQSPTASGRYNFNDGLLPNGIIYYRIENVDFNGNRNLSSTISIKNTLVKTEEWQVFPNPIQQHFFQIVTKNLKSGQYSFTLHSMHGELVFSQKLQVNNSSNLSIKLPAYIAKGLYTLSLNYLDSKISTRKTVFIQ